MDHIVPEINIVDCFTHIDNLRRTQNVDVSCTSLLKTEILLYADPYSKSPDCSEYLLSQNSF